MELNLSQGEVDREDEKLVGLMAGGDQNAFEALVRRWSGPVYSLALRIVRDEGAAEEVLQDVFLKAWSQAGKFDPHRGKFSSWVFAITHHRALDLLRAKKARGGDRLIGLPVESIPDVGASSVPEVTGWQKTRLDHVVDNLSKPQRQVVELAYYEGFAHEEIAHTLGIPLGTVKSRLRGALAALKRNFVEPEGEFRSRTRS